MTKISVYEYNIKNFLKSGKLATRAIPTLCISTGDTEAGDPTDYADIAKRIKSAVKGIHNLVTPYMFTHIILHSNALIDESNPEQSGRKTYFIYQEFITPAHKFMTSPTKLLEALKQ